MSEIRAELAEPYQNLFIEQKTKHGGFLIGEDHTKPDAKYWIAENATNMKAAGIHTIYIEHFFSGIDQKYISEFLEDMDKTKPMSPALQRLCNNFIGMKELLLAARENDMKIIGIGSTYTQANTAEDPYTRSLLLNQHAVEQIKNHQNSLDDNQKGFVVLAGHAHLVMHEGRDKSKPIQGMSQLLGMHSFEINDDNQIAVKDPDLIYEPSSRTYKKIDDYRRENKLTVEKTSYKDLDAKQKSSKTRFKSQTAKSTEKTQTRLSETDFVELSKEEINETRERFRKEALTFEEISKEDIKKTNEKFQAAAKKKGNQSTTKTHRDSKNLAPHGKK